MACIAGHTVKGPFYIENKITMRYERRKTVRTAIGTYLNIYSDRENGVYDNYNLPLRIDVFLIFCESLGDEVDVDAADEAARKAIQEFASTAKDASDLEALKWYLEKALIDYEVQVIVQKLRS